MFPSGVAFQRAVEEIRSNTSAPMFKREEEKASPKRDLKYMSDVIEKSIVTPDATVVVIGEGNDRAFEHEIKHKVT
jgi:hypothetical protein